MVGAGGRVALWLSMVAVVKVMAAWWSWSVVLIVVAAVVDSVGDSGEQRGSDVIPRWLNLIIFFHISPTST